MSSDMFAWEDHVGYALTHQAGDTEHGWHPKSNLILRGVYGVQLFDAEGRLKYMDMALQNGITNQGKNLALDNIFRGVTDGPQKSPWYFGIIDNSGYTAVSAADTYASHGGWNEFTTYDESTRVVWVEGAAASQAITNATPSTFTIGGNGTLRGVFLVSNSTKGDTAASGEKLWSTVLFASTVAVVDNDTLKITYTVNAG